MPATPSAPSLETPPEQQRPRPEDPQIDQADLPPMPKVTNVRAEVILPPKQPAEQQKRTPPPSPPPTPPAAAAQDTSAAPVQGNPTQGVATLEQTYDAQIVARIERKKRYPAQAMQQRIEDTVYLRLVIDRKGQITQADIVRSRKHALLDEAVRDLAQRVNPLPPMPQGLPGNSYTVTVPINFYINRRR